MPSARNYFVELRNQCGTTIGTHEWAHSEFDAMQRAAARNPGYRALWARPV